MSKSNTINVENDRPNTSETTRKKVYVEKRKSDGFNDATDSFDVSEEHLIDLEKSERALQLNAINLKKEKTLGSNQPTVIDNTSAKSGANTLPKVNPPKPLQNKWIQDNDNNNSNNDSAEIQDKEDKLFQDKNDSGQTDDSTYDNKTPLDIQREEEKYSSANTSPSSSVGKPSTSKLNSKRISLSEPPKNELPSSSNKGNTEATSGSPRRVSLKSVSSKINKKQVRTKSLVERWVEITSYNMFVNDNDHLIYMRNAKKRATVDIPDSVIANVREEVLIILQDTLKQYKVELGAHHRLTLEMQSRIQKLRDENNVEGSKSATHFFRRISSVFYE